MAASGALIQMAAQRCRAAVLDGPEHSELLPAQMGLISPDEVVARCTDDVGHLQSGRLYLFFFSRERLACWAVLITVRLSKGLATPRRCRRDRCRYQTTRSVRRASGLLETRFQLDMPHGVF